MFPFFLRRGVQRHPTCSLRYISNTKKSYENKSDILDPHRERVPYYDYDNPPTYYMPIPPPPPPGADDHHDPHQHGADAHAPALHDPKNPTNPTHSGDSHGTDHHGHDSHGQKGYMHQGVLLPEPPYAPLAHFPVDPRAALRDDYSYDWRHDVDCPIPPWWKQYPDHVEPHIKYWVEPTEPSGVLFGEVYEGKRKMPLWERSYWIAFVLTGFIFWFWNRSNKGNFPQDVAQRELDRRRAIYFEKRKKEAALKRQQQQEQQQHEGEVGNYVEKGHAV